MKEPGIKSDKISLIYAKRKHAEWERKSENFRRRYDKARDPKILKEWYRSSIFATKSGWFSDAIVTLRANDKQKVIDYIFSKVGRGSRENPTEYIKRCKLIWFKVELMRQGGSTKTKAFETLKDNFLGKSWSYDAIKNSYYVASRHKPEIFVEEKEKSISISVFPAIVEVNGSALAGMWKVEMGKGNIL